MQATAIAPEMPKIETTPALSVQNLSTGYPNDRFAIENVNFDVQHGERVAMIGPNGAGKSTLFKAIVGIVPMAKGRISINGRSCHDSHNLVGYVPQHSDIDWSFPVTVTDVVMMGRARQIGWLRFPRRGDWQFVQSLLEQLKLANLANRQIGELSGGQQRRVFIARALAQETQVLLMDEPFTGVDSTAERDIMDALDLLSAQGITMIMATHDLQKAAQHFDKMLLMRGTSLAYGTPDEVMQPDILKQAYGGAVRVFNDGTEQIFITDEHGCG